MFVRSQKVSYVCSLKVALKNEFGEQFSAKEVICRIQNRRLNRNETLMEYLYSIMEIGAQINLDESPFRKCIENYALVAKPLTDILRKSVQFAVNDEALLACHQLKEALVITPILKLYDPDAIMDYIYIPDYIPL